MPEVKAGTSPATTFAVAVEKFSADRFEQYLTNAITDGILIIEV